MVNYERIMKDCFWDYSFTEDELNSLSSSKNSIERSFLFQKILLNSMSLFSDLKIFKVEILRNLILNYRVPNFNSEYISKRKNMAEVYFLNKDAVVDELKWIA